MAELFTSVSNRERIRLDGSLAQLWENSEDLCMKVKFDIFNLPETDLLNMRPTVNQLHTGNKNMVVVGGGYQWQQKPSNTSFFPP